MKLIALADIHHAEEKWDQLVDVVRQQQPDIVAIAGDLMPKNSGILGQFDYLPYVRECAWKIRDAGSELVLILGNVMRLQNITVESGRLR
jgi:Icc-related predicted phosphoesterase